MSQSLPSQELDLRPMHHDSTETEVPFRKDTEPLFHFLCTDLYNFFLVSNHSIVRS